MGERDSPLPPPKRRITMATEKKTERTEKMVRIRLPITRDEKDAVPVWVNDRSWLIQRGVEVEVPECCAEVLRHREEALELQMRFEQETKHE